MLEVKDLTISVGSFQVKKVNFKVAEGSCHVLLGPTGSGKTLILESVAGLRFPQQGSIYLQGQEITRALPEKRKIAYLPQDLALFPTMTVRENIAYSLRFKRCSRKEQDAKIRELAVSLDIAEILNRGIHHLSGGEKQRVALARALASGSKIILLDEPLSSLHWHLRREIWYLLKKIQKEHNITFLLVTHDLEEAFFLGHTISIMHDGALLQTGTPEEVFNRPQSVEAARIVGVENFFPGRIVEVGKGHLQLYCPEMEAKFKLPAVKPWLDFGQGEKVLIGIRRESILMKEFQKNSARANTASFVVEDVNEKVSGRILLLRSLVNRNLAVLMELHKQNFSVVSGQKVELYFPGDKLMVFSLLKKK